MTTSEDGRFAYRIAKGPSRTIRFAYKAYTLDPAPVQTATLTLGVKAGLKLKLTPRRVTNGQQVRFKGTLKGGPARKGTRVTIDVLVPDARRRVADRQRQGRRQGPLQVRVPLPPHAGQGPLPLPGPAHAAARLPLQGRDVAAGVGRRLALTLRPRGAERLDHDRVELGARAPPQLARSPAAGATAGE